MPRKRNLFQGLMVIGVVLCLGVGLLYVNNQGGGGYITPFLERSQLELLDKLVSSLNLNNNALYVPSSVTLTVSLSEDEHDGHSSVTPTVSLSEDEHDGHSSVTKTVSLSEYKHDGHNGFNLATSTRNACTNSTVASNGYVRDMFYSPNKQIMFCPIAKIGSCFWNQVFIVHMNPSAYKYPHDVPYNKVYSYRDTYAKLFSFMTDNKLINDSTFSFLFVRNPYSRLFSAFVDKLVLPNPAYWGYFGKTAIAKYRLHDGTTPYIGDGQDATFTEFIKLVINAEKTGNGLDPHFASVLRNCNPCGINYKYIGKMESFKDDALFIIKKLGMKSTAEEWVHAFSNDSFVEALTDTIYTVFSRKASVIKKLSWSKALRRTWLNLQIRGIVELGQKFNLTNTEVNTYSAEQFVEYARKAHKKSDPKKLKKQKELAKIEAFRSIPIQDLIEFRQVFKPDLTLFGYETTPDYIFSRKEKLERPIIFNYQHLN